MAPVSTNEFRNGMHIELDGQPWRIVEFQHVKPGKGGAFVRTKLKGLGSGAVVDRTFRAGEKFSRVHTETKNVQYLYDDGGDVHFMDSESYDQVTLSDEVIGEQMAYLLPNTSIRVDLFDGNPVGIELPNTVTLKVVETQPGMKGATASASYKPARLETGLSVMVPQFIEVGTRIKVDTRDNTYLERA